MSESPLMDKQVAKSPFERLNIFSANMALLFSLPFFFLFAFLGNQGRGVAATISVGMTVLVVRMRWDLKGYAWFWAVVVGLLLLHVPLVMLVPWSSSNTYSRVVLLPGALLDLVIIYNVVRLAEKMFTKNAGEGSAS